MPIQNNHILLIDDDPDLFAVLNLKLAKEGFNVRSALDGDSGFSEIKNNRPDLVLLDIDMPGIDGLQLCKTLRSQGETKNLPIILLTGRDEQIDKLLGLEFGADDYITKPFNIRELVLRVKNVLKRVYPTAPSVECFRIGCLWVDFESHAVKVKNQEIDLTLTEFKLLVHLIEQPGKTKSRDVLLEKIWDYGDGVYSRTIDTHIQRLRSKLKEAGSYIQTVRGVGYRFKESK